MERTGIAPRVYGNNNKPSKGKVNYYGPQPMELDAVNKRPQHQNQRKPLSKEVMDKRRQEGLCFECGNPGHRADSHREGKQGKGRGKKNVSVVTRVERKPEIKYLCAATAVIPSDGTNSNNFTTSSPQLGDSPESGLMARLSILDNSEDCCQRKTNGKYCLCEDDGHEYGQHDGFCDCLVEDYPMAPYSPLGGST